MIRVMKAIILAGLILVAYILAGAEVLAAGPAVAGDWWDKYFWHVMLILGMYGVLRVVQKMKQCHDCWPEYIGPFRICKLKTSKDGKHTFTKLLTRWLDLTAFLGTFGVSWYCITQIVVNADGLTGPIRSNVHTPEQVIAVAAIIAGGQFVVLKAVFYLIHKFAGEETANSLTDGIYTSEDDTPTEYAFKKVAQTLVLGGGEHVPKDKRYTETPEVPGKGE